MAKSTLQERAQEILKLAEESGAQSHFFFLTTFKRYQVQIKLLDELEKSIKDEGTLVSKEYVKGRKNLYENPAVAAYNRTTDSANKTVSTLMKIIRDYNVKEDSDEDEDPLMRYLNGGNDE